MSAAIDRRPQPEADEPSRHCSGERRDPSVARHWIEEVRPALGWLRIGSARGEQDEEHEESDEESNDNRPHPRSGGPPSRQASSRTPSFVEAVPIFAPRGLLKRKSGPSVA